MSIGTASLAESASAISALGVCRADIDALDDAALTEGMRIVGEHELAVQKYKLWLAAAIARRSHHELGYDGLARRSGSATPAVFIQKLTGTSLNEATKLARLGAELVDDESAPTGSAPVTSAVAAGGLTIDAADAIRRGLGAPDEVVDAEQLAEVAESLIEDATHLTPEALLKAARLKRAAMDEASIERGERERSDARYARIWSRDGMSGGSWALPDEDGGLEIYNTMKLMLAAKTGGPRFAETTPTTTGTTRDGNPHDGITETSPAPDDTRSMDQILADGFATIFHNGLTADPGIVPGSGRAPVRVIVTEQHLTGHTPHGSGTLAVIEDTHMPISGNKLTEYLCGGTIEVTLTPNGHPVDVGREQRLFTTRQRIALAVRDGGCRFPGCTKPPSWTEAHHLKAWAKNHGRTDINNGILLCRYHHMLTHNRNWAIIQDAHGQLWLKPAKDHDPHQRLIPMPTKNPLIRGASTGSASG